MYNEDKTNTSASKYENQDLVSQIVIADSNTNAMFDRWKLENMRNWRMVGGHLLSTADKEKLAQEFRPDFEYNLLLPFLLQLVGNFKSSPSKVEATGRGRDDFPKAKIHNQVLDYIHYTENDLLTETAKAYVDALVNRIGWLVVDWSTKKDPLGNVHIRRYDWRRMKFDPTFTESDLSDCDWLMDSGFYTPEEMKMIWGLEDEALWHIIDENAKEYLGDDIVKKGKIASQIQRLGGAFIDYLGEKVGYDVTSYRDDAMTNSGEVFNSQTNTFKVIEFHERRAEIRFMATDDKGAEVDVTEYIEAKSRTEYNNDKMELIKKELPGSNIVPVKKEFMWQTTVCPAFNLVFEDKKYEIQNGLYKYVPIFCFDFNIEPMEYKSYIDHMKDPVASYNLRRNTELTILMRSAHRETWYEEDALGEYEDAFTNTNEIGGAKKVKKDAIRMGTIKEVTSNVNFSGLAGYAAEDKQNLKEISGMEASSLGQTQSSQDSGVLLEGRVAQTNIMQMLPHENAMRQLKLVGRYTISLYQKFMTIPRIFRITDEGNDEEVVEVNVRTIDGIKNDLSEGEFDIKLSIAPFGKQAQQQEFQETVVITKMLAEIKPAYADPKLLVKASGSRYTDDFLKHINQVDKAGADEAQETAQIEKAMVRAGVEQVINDNAKTMAETEKTEMEADKIEVEINKINAEIGKIEAETDAVDVQALLDKSFKKEHEGSEA